jgi:formylglycine-generating enzyme required for sulfatase activity
MISFSCLKPANYQPQRFVVYAFLWTVIFFVAVTAQDNPQPKPKPKPATTAPAPKPTTARPKATTPKRTRTSGGGGTTASRDAEVVFWDSIKNSNDPEDYKAYLRKYPNGTFADLARRRAGLGTSSEIKPSAGNETKPAESRPAPPRVTTRVEFVRIPAGEFMMGSSEGEDNEKPVHRVVLSRSFEMGKYEVTQAQWEAVMGNNPSYFKGADLPVEQVSWEDIQYFLQAMNAKNDGYVYRLPTEAEWEYACRAGTTTPHAGYLDGMGWYEVNSGKQTHPVGTKQPNAWGLYDMHGNVWEWCLDWYGDYPSNTVTDPRGPSTGSRRVARGGSWRGPEACCRSANRSINSPGGRGSDLGFRLVRQAR